MSKFVCLTIAVAVYVVMGQEEESDGLPAGGDQVLSNYPPGNSFDCSDKPFGYYADIESDCELFHICNPVLDNDGIVLEVAKYSFFCPNQTFFDQSTLTCNHKIAADAFPCAESESLFNSVPFGEKELPAFEDEDY